jgi:putative phage-type endonuclease
MILVNVQQGSPEWHELRAKHFNASEAPAMMGISKFKTRNELLKEKATGIIPEVDAVTQKKFDDGHRKEAAARPIAESILGDDLFPVTGVNDIEGLSLLASLDGITENRNTIWEHKSLNNQYTKLSDNDASAEDIVGQHWPQLEQQLLVSDAAAVMFMASNGTEKGMVVVHYQSIPERRAQLIAGWKQFTEDLGNYVHTKKAPAAVAKAVKSLPAVSIQVNGAIALTDNLSVFGEALTQYVEQINKEPETDQDFANLESVVKSLKAAEEALSAAENGALAQASSIDEMRRTVGLYRNMARDNRLIVEKLVKSEKENRRIKILQSGKDALSEHIAKLNALIGKPYMPVIQADFVGVMRGKKTIDSLQSAVNNELARAKIEASEVSAKIQTNMISLRELAEDYKFLFTDVNQLVMKENDDLIPLIKLRISEYKEEEQKKIDAAAAEQLKHKEVAEAIKDLPATATASVKSPVELDINSTVVVDDAPEDIVTEISTYSVKSPLNASCISGEIMLTAFNKTGPILPEDAVSLRDQLTQAIKKAILAKEPA